MNKLLILTLTLLASASCTEDKLIGEQQVKNENGEIAVHFSGGMDLTATKADGDPVAVATGVKAYMAAYYTKSQTVDANKIASHGYTVGATAGTFVGDDAYTMYLAKGSYDFYSASASTEQDVPVFTGGVSDVLHNGTNYISGRVEDKSIPTVKDINFAYARKAVQIYIKIKAGTGLKMTGWGDTNPAQITAPAPTGEEGKMTLSTGEIAPTNAVTAIGMMATTFKPTAEGDTTASYIMLPLVQDKELTVTLKAKVNIGEVTTSPVKTYTATLTAPKTVDNNNSTAFLSGKKYTYTATLSGNAITFTNATVSDWTEVVTTDDLEPTEPEP